MPPPPPPPNEHSSVVVVAAVVVPQHRPDWLPIRRVRLAVGIKKNALETEETVSAKEQLHHEARILELLSPDEECIVCQVKLGIPIRRTMMVDVADNIGCAAAAVAAAAAVTTTTSMPLLTCSSITPSSIIITETPDDNDDDIPWTLEPLNWHGRQPPRSTASFSSTANANGNATKSGAFSSPLPVSLLKNTMQNVVDDDEDCCLCWDHEFYILYHTHAHAVKGNRPLAIATLRRRRNLVATTASVDRRDNAADTTTGVYTLEWVSSPMNFNTTTDNYNNKPGCLSIHFQYTAGMGRLPPPLKNHWTNGGCIQTCYLVVTGAATATTSAHTTTVAGIMVPPWESSPSSFRMFVPPQPTRVLPPSSSHSVESNINNECMTALSEFDRVLAFGDSILEQLVASKRESAATTTPNKNSAAPQSISFGEKVAMPLSNRTVPLLLQALDESFGDLLRHGSSTSSTTYLPTTTKSTKIALILNSALWDILSDEATTCTVTTEPNDAEGDASTARCAATNDDSTNQSPWTDHLCALKDYIAAIQQRYCGISNPDVCGTKNNRDPATCNSGTPTVGTTKESTTNPSIETNSMPPPLPPRITLFWLLPTAVHIHRVHLADNDAMHQRAPQKINRTRYMSASRSLHLYQCQQDVLHAHVGTLQQLQPPSEQSGDSFCPLYFLDLYEATYLSADWTLPGDGRHYRPELNQRMLSWLW